jgi:hypothetical protein
MTTLDIARDSCSSLIFPTRQSDAFSRGGQSSPTRSCSRSMTFPAFRPRGTFTRTVGLVPGADNSTGKTHHKRSRDGNRYLKLAFHHAAVCAVQYVPDQARVSALAAEGEEHCAGARGERIGDHRLRGPHEASGIQWHLPWTRPNDTEAAAVAPAGEAARITGTWQWPHA